MISHLYSRERPPWEGDRVIVRWGAKRGAIGKISVLDANGTVWCTFPDDGNGSNPISTHIVSALRRIEDEAPTFSTREECLAWMDLPEFGDQIFAVDQEVRLYQTNTTRGPFQWAKIIRYLGIEGSFPPKYIVEIADGELKIAPEYFIRPAPNSQ